LSKVSSNIPEIPQASPIFDNVGGLQKPSYVPADFLPPEAAPSSSQWALSLLLLGLTFCTTTFAGFFYATGFFDFRTLTRFLLQPAPQTLLASISFSFPLIVILAAHELGHYLACRYYGMRCTPPYFIPAPLPITGTLGAFIKIKSNFRTKKALFDVGIAGPLAGFLFSLPVLWIGISISRLTPKLPPKYAGMAFGEPLLFKLIGMAALGYAPERQDVIAHPMAMAGWVGLLATSLNLLPIWQLDGGHIAYATLGAEWHKKLSFAAVAVLIIVSFLGWPTPSYLLFGLLLLIIGWRLRFYHPAPLVDEGALGPGRTILAFVALLILILSFTPIPITA
jgi:membrane-associated protease RseP (regulator of RpoE activity)